MSESDDHTVDGPDRPIMRRRTEAERDAYYVREICDLRDRIEELERELKGAIKTSGVINERLHKSLDDAEKLRDMLRRVRDVMRFNLPTPAVLADIAELLGE